jgi:hypothetical protein
VVGPREKLGQISFLWEQSLASLLQVGAVPGLVNLQPETKSVSQPLQVTRRSPEQPSPENCSGAEYDPSPWG